MPEQPNHQLEAPKGDDEQDSSFMPEAKRLVLEQLRKLQHHNRSNVPAEMAQKAKASFSVSADSDDADVLMNASVSVLVYPQDPFVSEPKVREMAASELKPGLRNTRVWIRDSVHPVAQPDLDNNYLYWTDTPAFNQVNAFYYITLTLRMYERLGQRQIPWAFTSPRVTVDPHAGVGLNAFYDEENRMIGFYNFVHENGDVINTAQSADVVAHEAGHAVLDGLRDLYNQSFGLGPLAFHESFGDMSAVLVALHDDELVRRLLDWTEGDLRVENFVAEVAERIMEKIQQVAEFIDEIDERTVYLRNAVNMFKYVPFDDLTYQPADPRYELGRESHNYSRLFTGAFYDVLVNVYEHIRGLHDLAPQIALHRARDIVGHLLIYAVECGPVGELDFSDMARSFLTADMLLHDGMYTPSLIEAFTGRDILSLEAAHEHLNSLKALPDLTLPDHVDSSLEAGIFLVDKGIPALGLPDDVDYTPMSAHRTKRGFAFLTYFTVRTITLEGPQFDGFDGVQVDAFGGVTLVFDPSGKLRSALYRPVTDEDARQIQLLTADQIRHGLVTEMTFAGGSRVLSDEVVAVDTPSVRPRFLYMAGQLKPTGQVIAKLVRDPMILDSVPLRKDGFLEYLRRWRKAD
jgi:hypothetical protein